MSKYGILKEDLKKYQLNREADKVGTLRFLISELNNYAISAKKSPEDLDDSEVEEVLVKIGKQRNESIEAFTKGNRQDLVEKEQADLDIINTYLPEKLSEEETQAAVAEIMTELKITTKQQMGLLMAEVKKRYGATVDMGAISKYVGQKLA